ncbi:MAG: SDR family oxidoreductase [Oscillospiraceae bacterium]|nr:SDR family oxidoreductase [Oscillospiraceae bacterium]
MMKSKVAVVTGGSSGIGLWTAYALRDTGCTVYELSRRDMTHKGITHISVDVTDEAAAQAAVKQIFDEQGSVDILVNCAGFGISGAVEFTELEDAKRQFDVNFFGIVNMCKAAIPCMRASGGRIVNVSSVAAVAHIPFQTFYSASKAAIESYTCALANELKPFGITVTCAQPGDICTGFTDARKKNAVGDDIYGGRISRSVAGMEKDERKGMSPEFAGKYIAKLALRKCVKPIYTVGFGYKFLSVLCKILPCGFRNWIVGLLYAR